MSEATKTVPVPTSVAVITCDSCSAEQIGEPLYGRPLIPGLPVPAWWNRIKIQLPSSGRAAVNVAAMKVIDLCPKCSATVVHLTTSK